MPPIPVNDDSFGGAISLNQGLLPSENLDRARQAFHNLVQRYEGQQLDLQVRVNPTSRKSYKKITLIRETYSHCKNQDALLQHFFTSLGVMYYQDTESDFAKGLSTVEDFLSQPPADHQAMLLFDYSDDLLIFYAKMKTRLAEDALKTPSHHSKNATPNEQRKEKLRTDCLRRDHHRCVVTHMFHRTEAYRRRRESGRLKIARDDEGKVIDIRQPGGECYDLEVAHIVPFFILQPPEGMELDHSQRFAITVLNMFDANITALIGGVKRDTPKNALTLAKSIYPAFGAFEIFFDETQGSHNVYRVSSHDEVISDANELPRNVDFNYPICQDIDPPSRRLLAIHRAISEILHLSMAGEYIDEVFREVEEPCAQSNGSTNLGDILSLKLNDTIRSNSV